MDDATLERYARLFHEQGRLTVNAEREKPFGVEPWEKRTPEQQEIDMRGAEAVAVQAVRDAGLDNDRIRVQLLAFAAERDRVVREMLRRADRAVGGVERDAWLAAAEVARGEPG